MPGPEEKNRSWMKGGRINMNKSFHHKLHRSEDSMWGVISIQMTSEDKHLEEPDKNVPSIHFTLMGGRTERCWEGTRGRNVACCYKRQFQEEKALNSAAESREAKKEAGWETTSKKVTSGEWTTKAEMLGAQGDHEQSPRVHGEHTSLVSCSSKKKASIIHGSLPSFVMFQMHWESWKQLYLIKQKPWRFADSGTRSSSILSSGTATLYQDWLGGWETTCGSLVPWVSSFDL